MTAKIFSLPSVQSNRQTAPSKRKTSPRSKSNEDTIDTLKLLLAEAMAGRLIGLAFMAMQDGRGYIVDTAGECTANPTFTRGACQALDDELARRIMQ